MTARRLTIFAIHIAFAGLSALTHAAQPEPGHVVGRIVSFDEKKVRVKSGNETFDILKNDLNFPSYRTGAQIEFDMPEEKLRSLRVSHQKIK